MDQESLRKSNQYRSTQRHTSTCILETLWCQETETPVPYYFNTTATFCPLLLGNLVFKLNPGPAHTSSHLNVLKQNIQRSRSTRNTENLITPDRVRLYPSDQQLTLSSLSAFLNLVCDVRADLFTICET